MLHVSRWKTVLIWFAVLLSVFFAAPNLLSDRQLAALPAWFPHKTVALGLDLQGGSHIMLKLERDDIVKERLEAIVADIAARLRGAKIRYTGLTGVGQKVTVTVTDPAQVQA